MSLIIWNTSPSRFSAANANATSPAAASPLLLTRDTHCSVCKIQFRGSVNLSMQALNSHLLPGHPPIKHLCVYPVSDLQPDGSPYRHTCIPMHAPPPVPVVQASTQPAKINLPESAVAKNRSLIAMESPRVRHRAEYVTLLLCETCRRSPCTHTRGLNSIRAYSRNSSVPQKKHV